MVFFACRDIEKGEELTFNYLDKEEDEVVSTSSHRLQGLGGLYKVLL